MTNALCRVETCRFRQRTDLRSIEHLRTDCHCLAAERRGGRRPPHLSHWLMIGCAWRRLRRAIAPGSSRCARWREERDRYNFSTRTRLPSCAPSSCREPLPRLHPFARLFIRYVSRRCQFWPRLDEPVRLRRLHGHGRVASRRRGGPQVRAAAPPNTKHEQLVARAAPLPKSKRHGIPGRARCKLSGMLCNGGFGT